MDIVMDRSARTLAAVLLTMTMALSLSACAASSTSSQELTHDQAPTPAAGASIDAGGGGGGGGSSGSGEATVTGSLVSSGIYDATWKWEAGNAAGPGIGGITVNSDKATFGNIQVLSDGSISFSTGAPEISGGSRTRAPVPRSR